MEHELLEKSFFLELDKLLQPLVQQRPDIADDAPETDRPDARVQKVLEQLPQLKSLVDSLQQQAEAVKRAEVPEVPLPLQTKKWKHQRRELPPALPLEQRTEPRCVSEQDW